MTLSATVTVYKSSLTSLRPWSADLEFQNKTLKSWMHGFKTKRALMQEVIAVTSGLAKETTIVRK